MPAVSAISPSSVVAPQPSPWHSPVPYLFGGLAVMMGLIAFALLVLAYSMWMNSGYFQNGDRDIESRNGNNPPPESNNKRELSDKKYLVIMAGEAKPTTFYSGVGFMWPIMMVVLGAIQAGATIIKKQSLFIKGVGGLIKIQIKSFTGTMKVDHF
ncbi:hypothetical protein L1987_14357 [Smallanthus sonchifolius]|uniref:Uncharacterized protein n=1 Tax=Smallanthus sonchifolius TaxID=185202 RepID=A0ACB9J4V3_9ASTR|nr:hypothetical protein L1987_14357 [Smallanthus sonchifolius]